MKFENLDSMARGTDVMGMANLPPSAATATRLSPIGVDPSTSDDLAKIVAIGASECLIGARTLDAGFSDLTGEYILTFHALELGLKAFLIKNGLTEADLSRRPYGHDLVALYAEAKTRGLSVTHPDIDATLSTINEWHNTGVKIRYDFMSVRRLPMCVTLFPLIEAIIETAGKGP